MRRNIESLIKRIREELRAEGPDGAGYSDFFIIEELNAALNELSGIYSIRVKTPITTQVNVNEYIVPDFGTIENIFRVTYDNLLLENISMADYLDKNTTAEGNVTCWLLWGDKIILNGAVLGDKTLELWHSRAPLPLTSVEQEPEIPQYADTALCQYVIASCYRESRDYDRASTHHRIFLNKKNDLLRRGIPQTQREQWSAVRARYSQPFRGNVKQQQRSDTNPGGI